MVYIVEVESINTSNPYLLPLSSFFNFDFSFSMLSNVISNNTPIFFFIKYSTEKVQVYYQKLYQAILRKKSQN